MTFSNSIMLPFEVGFVYLKCSYCGRDIKGTLSHNIITVSPCKKCLAEAELSGREKEYEELK